MNPIIVVPFDFSDVSARALAWAADLQRSVGGKLHAIHTIDPMPAISAGAPIAVPLCSGEDIAGAERALEDALAKYSGTATGEVVITAATGDAIVTAARRRGANLIVMGTHGRGGFKRAVLGSVADYVVRHADCPVVTMRTTEKG